MIQQLIDYCLQKPGASEDFPFDDTTLVIKVMGKMFFLTGLDDPRSINLKCDPLHAVALRHKYAGVKPGYHMNKKHWNTVELDAGIPLDEIKSWIDESYALVVKSLPRESREGLKED